VGEEERWTSEMGRTQVLVEVKITGQTDMSMLWYGPATPWR